MSDDSSFLHALKAALTSCFVVIGIFVGLIVAFLLIFLLSLGTEKESFKSSAKLQPDADFNRKELAHSAPILLQISIKGVIGLDGLTGEKVQKVLLSSREDNFKNNRVKGILLSINSPGGGSFDSDQIYRLLLEYKERLHVPIFAHVDGVCASGGYYIACAADQIYSTEGSLVGSIGVIGWPPFLNITKLMEKIGVDALTIYAGKGKDAMNPTRPWKEGEQKSYQEIITFLYDQFTSIVAKHRPLLTEERLNELGAQVFPGPIAKEYGYVDHFGSRNQVLTALAQAAGIPEGTKYQVDEIEKRAWLARFLSDENSLWTGKIKHEVKLPKELQMPLSHPFCYLWPPLAS